MTQISMPGAAGVSYPGSHPLVARITRLRGRVRLILGLLGIGVVCAAAVGGLFFLMLCDYLLHFNAAIRFTLLIAGLLTLAYLVWRYLFLPLSTRLTDQFLASRVENINKDLSDELMSAIHFIHSGAAASNILAARHIDMAAQRTSSIRFEEAVDFRQSGKALGLAAILILIAGMVALLNPESTRIAWSRWFSASPIPWPVTSHVSFDWSDYGGAPPKVIPLGERFTIRARVDKGPKTHVRLYDWSDKKSTSYQLMTFQEKQSTPPNYIYETTLEPEGSRLSLRVEAGDDVAEPEVRIGLSARPVISEMFASITPPPYVKNVKDPTLPVPAVVADLLTQAGRAVEGAKISLRVRSTKPFRTDASGIPDLRILEQEKETEFPISMTRRLIDSSVAEISFNASKTIQGRMVIRDTDGFENRVGGTITMEVVPDGMPSIVITEPRRSVERSPTAMIEMLLQATDDQGLDDLKLVADKFDAKPGDPPVFTTPLVWLERTVDAAVGSTTGRATYTWDLTPLNLQPGARLLFYAMVRDNYDLDGKRHDWVKSAPLSLQIRTESEIINQARKDLNEVKDRIRNLRNQQETTRSLTEAVRKVVEASNTTSPQQKSQLSDLSVVQSQEATSATAIQQRAEQIADTLRQNRLTENEMGKLAQEVSAGMNQVGQQDMPKAASDLNKAQESAGNQNSQNARQQAQQTAQSAASANTQQEAAITKMDNMLDKLAATGDFEASRRAVAEILKKQQDLNKQTTDISPKIVGQNNVPKDVREQQQQIATKQRDLSDQTTATIDQMIKSADAMNQSDPASAQSLQRAANAGKEGQVSPSQQNASSNLSDSKTNDAQSQQSKATSGLQQMMDELNKNERRQLEQLARQLADLLREVQDRHDREDALNKETVTAGAAAASAELQKLGDKQETLHSSTIMTQKKAESTRQAQEAAGDIREGANEMGTAAGALYANKQADAPEPQTRAVAALQRAIDKLKKALENVNSQLKDKDLAEFIKQYEEIKAAQITVKESADAVEARRQAAADKEVDHIGGVQLAELAKKQNELIGKVTTLSTDEKLKVFDVVVWMNGQVTEAMAISQDRMKKVQMGPQLAFAQQTSIDRLEMIIDALKDEQKRESEFRSQGGGGGGGGGQRPLVPALAQLKLLKAMQTVVNGQTRTASNSIESAKDDAEKSQLQNEVENLGKKQGEIKTIADKVVQSMSR